jgi:hypothetical protein
MLTAVAVVFVSSSHQDNYSAVAFIYLNNVALDLDINNPSAS